MQFPETSSPWQQLLQQVAAHLLACEADPQRSIVLLPYAQLLPVARAQWLRLQPQGLLPRFDTTANWAARRLPFVPAQDDLAQDAAQDMLTATQWLRQAGQGQAEARWLAGRVREAALQLAPVAAAVPPEQRADWLAQLQPQLAGGLGADALRYEALLAHLALVWAASSSHATDGLFDAVAQQELDALVVLRGFQHDALADSLLAQFRAKRPQAVLELDMPAFWPPRNAQAMLVRLHEAHDLEDQAECAVTCVQLAVEQGQGLVALVDSDRALTRRIRALLEGQGLTIRDETGWKLSTTRAASQLIALLRACAWQADSDTVLDWLKQAAVVAAPAQDGALPPVPESHVQAAEAWLRRRGAARWPQGGIWQQWDHPAAAWVQTVEQWRAQLRAARPLAQWLQDVRAVLHQSGQWDWLQADPAGQELLRALRMQPAAVALHDAGDNWPQESLLHWVQDVLEAGSFRPPYPLQEQVVIVPLSQLLARDFAAVVIPGCDETRLPAAPEPPGDWTSAQRALLGLPLREALQAAQRAAWQHALQLPQVDLLTSASDGKGENLLPSPLLLEWQYQHGVQAMEDPRIWKRLQASPVAMPLPQGGRLPLDAISASAYDMLRACPYQFFARQQLRLQEIPELQAGLEKRDFGIWLHRLLYVFHQQLLEDAVEASHAADLAARMDSAAMRAMDDLGIEESEFIPYQAIWPCLRDGYLKWLAQHEGNYAQGEMPHSRDLQDICASEGEGMPVPAVRLHGRIDRMDTLASTADQEGGWLLLDYKSESAAKTKQRLRQPEEDTQLAFYAALLAPEPVRVGYLNVGEDGETSMDELKDIASLRDQLLRGMADDLGRIVRGAPLPALGQGDRCGYCVARGLCRRDFWEQEQ